MTHEEILKEELRKISIEVDGKSFTEEEWAESMGDEEGQGLLKSVLEAMRMAAEQAWNEGFQNGYGASTLAKLDETKTNNINPYKTKQ